MKHIRLIAAIVLSLSLFLQGCASQSRLERIASGAQSIVEKEKEINEKLESGKMTEKELEEEAEELEKDVENMTKEELVKYMEEREKAAKERAVKEAEEFRKNHVDDEYPRDPALVFDVYSPGYVNVYFDWLSPEYGYYIDFAICTGYRGTAEEVRIPNTYNGMPVVAVGSSKEHSFAGLKRIELPDSVQIIDNNTFRGSNIESIGLSDNLKYIGREAFRYCGNLKSIEIPEGVKSIEEEAFSLCVSLREINLGNVVYIAVDSFNGCSSLQTVNIPSGITEIWSGTFENCESLESVTIPDGVKSIGTDAFRGCHSLKNITIPDSVESIGAAAFAHCKSLTSVSIPDNVAFSERKHQNSAFMSRNLPSEVYALQKEDRLSGYYSRSSHVGGAFEFCTSLQEVSIGKNVSYISQHAFAGCISLNSVNLPENLVEIGENAFMACYSLTDISLPKSLEIIGDDAFSLVPLNPDVRNEVLLINYDATEPS